MRDEYITFDPKAKKLVILNQAFSAESIIRIPVGDVKNEWIQAAWKNFKVLLPDHPDEENTEVILVKNEAGSPWLWDLLFVCTHFESSHVRELNALAIVLDDLNEISTDGDSAHIVLLGTHSEKLIVEVLDIDITMFEDDLKTAGYRINLPSEGEGEKK